MLQNCCNDNKNNLTTQLSVIFYGIGTFLHYHHYFSSDKTVFVRPSMYFCQQNKRKGDMMNQDKLRQSINVMIKKSVAYVLFSKKCCIFAACFCWVRGTDIAGNKRHWKSTWVSETAKSSSPASRPPVSVHIGTDYCSCRGKALGGAKIPTVTGPCLFAVEY